MKFLLSILPVMVLAFSGSAQTITNGTAKQTGLNFYDVQKQFYDEHPESMYTEEEEESTDAGIYQQFKRWEWFMAPRVYPTGVFPDPQILYNEYRQYKKAHSSIVTRHSSPATSSQAANWSPIGPDVIPGGSGGMGRINCLVFDPTNSNTMYVGTACGGLWKSTNGGATWSSNTDFLPALSISDIAISPLNTNLMYLSTGDKYGIYSSYETTGHYSAGILKSTDGGATWDTTGMSYAQNNNVLIQRLVMNPVNSNIQLLANKNGILRTTDGWTTWAIVKTGFFYDIEFNPLNPNVVFACNSTGVYRSDDGGVTWITLSANLGVSGRHSVAVTPADTNVVYVWCKGSLFRSSNGGTTFTASATSPTSYTTPYGYYDIVLAVSPIDANVVYTGGLEVAKSINGGASWTKVSNWNSWPNPNYVHADSHDLQFLPGSGSTVFACNDGGIFKTVNNGTSWTDLSGGLAISEFYRFSNAPQDPNLILAGAQDNGTDRFDGATWKRIYGADGMETMIDYLNANNVYAAHQSGVLEKSTDGGATWQSASPSYGAWVTPFIMHPTNPQILFSGYGDVYKSVDGALNWNKISNGQTSGAYIDALAIAPSDPNYIYFSSAAKIFKTTVGGTTWTNINGNLPNLSITYIAISPNDPDKVWVTMSGYLAGYKVFKTIDGGANWTNVSGTLPNIPANCIVYEKNTNDGVYIGTDMGVYYTDSTMADWIYYNDGLPNVIIDELEIHYGAGKLRAATYGRGIWESDLYSKTIGVPGIEGRGGIALYPNPSKGLFNLALNNTNVQHLNIQVFDAIGDVVKEMMLENISGDKIIEIDLSLVSNGVYFLKATGDNLNRLEKIFVMK